MKFSLAASVFHVVRTCLLLLSLSPFLPNGEAAEARRPNLVFILADDLGGHDLGCYGSTFYETPNLDKFAAQGMRFTHAYAACNVCSPTRASLLTGKYPARLHLTDWLPGRPNRPDQKLNRPIIIDHLPLAEVTFAEAMKDAGYAAGFLGKWHLGGEPYSPDKQGFDLNLGGGALGHPPSYFSPYKIPTLSDGPKGEYLTDRLTEEALKFIEQKKDQPFLLYFSHYAVHNPQQAKPELVAKFQAKLEAMPASAEPEFISDHGRQVRTRQDKPVYAAMVASLDESVGRVMAKLAELGLEKNTIVVFFSDNGGLSTAEGTPTANRPLRLGKGWNYEGGIREPLLVKWPGVTKPGSVCASPVIATDFYPTFLEMCALPARPQQHVDGVSLAPLLRGGTLPERALFWHYPHYSNQGGPPGGAVRLGDFKLIEHFEEMRTELYNLQDDIGEQTDLAAKFPAKAAAMRDQLHAWRAKVGAQMPSPNPAYKPVPQ